MKQWRFRYASPADERRQAEELNLCFAFEFRLLVELHRHGRAIALVDKGPDELPANQRRGHLDID